MLLGLNSLISMTTTLASTASPVSPSETRSVAMTGGFGLNSTLGPMLSQETGKRPKIQTAAT
jgi:hypothetical protein